MLSFPSIGFVGFRAFGIGSRSWRFFGFRKPSPSVTAAFALQRWRAPILGLDISDDPGSSSGIDAAARSYDDTWLQDDGDGA